MNAIRGPARSRPCTVSASVALPAATEPGFAARPLARPRQPHVNAIAGPLTTTHARSAVAAVALPEAAEPGGAAQLLAPTRAARAEWPPRRFLMPHYSGKDSVQ